MGLRDVVAKAANAAFAAAGDIPVSVVLRRFQGTRSRDMNTGQYQQDAIDQACVVIYDEIKRYEGRANVLTGDRLAIVRRSQLSFIPAPGDMVVDTEITYIVVSVGSDPTDQVFELHIRRSTQTIHVVPPLAVTTSGNEPITTSTGDTIITSESP